MNNILQPFLKRDNREEQDYALGEDLVEILARSKIERGINTSKGRKGIYG